MTELLTISPKEAQALERQYRIVSKSVDARQRNLRVNLSILLDEEGRRVPKDAPVPLYEPPHFQDVHAAEKLVYTFLTEHSSLRKSTLPPLSTGNMQSSLARLWLMRQGLQWYLGFFLL